MEAGDRFLSVRVGRPVEGCRLSTHGYLSEAVTTDRGLERQGVPTSQFFLRWRWRRSERQPGCASAQCPQGNSYSPLDWRTDARRGWQLQCVPCLKSRMFAPHSFTFCSAECFQAGWKEHRKQHARQRAAAGSRRAGSRSPVLQGADADPVPAGAAEASEQWELVSSESSYLPSSDDIGRRLVVECEAVSKANGEVLCARSQRTEPVLSAPPLPPPRVLLRAGGGFGGVVGSAEDAAASAGRLRVVSYNMLAEIYATRSAYPYCDGWALTWEYRRRNLLREVLAAQADVLCLQEVQKDHYDRDLLGAMRDAGYDGTYKQKTRESMGAPGKVDGCAVFWRADRLRLAEQYAVEFNDAAYREAPRLDLSDREEHAYLSRLLKDNVAQVSVLELLRPEDTSGFGGASICVCNTHLLSNKDLPDVKLWQALTLVQELEPFVLERGLPLIMCGDLNSGTDSAVYELLSTGQLSAGHPELQAGGDVQVLPAAHNISHRLQLASAFAVASGAEPRYTNFTKNFVGTLDYCFVTDDLIVEAVSAIPEEEVLTRGGEALPNTQLSSDHILMIVDLRLYDAAPPQGPPVALPQGVYAPPSVVPQQPPVLPAHVAPPATHAIPAQAWVPPPSRIPGAEGLGRHVL